MEHFILHNKTSFFFSNKMGNVEYVNPRDFLKIFHKRSISPAIWVNLKVKHNLSLLEKKALVSDIANSIAEEQMSKLEKIQLPQCLYSLLDQELSKKEQIKLLKGASITKEQLGALFIQAGAKGYLFSNFQFEEVPKEYRERDLPSFIFLKDDGDVENYGKHNLSEGQLKDMVIRSKRIIARFLDKGKHWHCFYQTSSGIQGEERGKFGSHPHVHYISDAFGVTREDIVSALKGGIAVHSNVHILLK